MGPEKDGQDIWFAVPEAANVLGVSRQAVYAAISAGQLPARDTQSGKQVHVQDLLAYGIQTGKKPQDLVNRIQEDTKAEGEDLLLWVLGGLGLLLLVKSLLGKK